MKRKRNRWRSRSSYLKAEEWKREGWIDVGECKWWKAYAGPDTDVVVVRDFNTYRIAGTRTLPAGVLLDYSRADLWRLVQMLKKPLIGVARPENPGARKPINWAKEFPTLASYMFDKVWEDGTRRVPSTLTVMAAEAAGFKAVLNDREGKQSLWANGEDWLDLCLALEVLLADDNPPWVPDPKWQKK